MVTNPQPQRLYFFVTDFTSGLVDGSVRCFSDGYFVYFVKETDVNLVTDVADIFVNGNRCQFSDGCCWYFCDGNRCQFSDGYC